MCLCPTGVREAREPRPQLLVSPCQALSPANLMNVCCDVKRAHRHQTGLDNIASQFPSCGFCDHLVNEAHSSQADDKRQHTQSDGLDPSAWTHQLHQQPVRENGPFETKLYLSGMGALERTDTSRVLHMGTQGFRSFSPCNSYVALGTTFLLCELKISLETQEYKQGDWYISTYSGPWVLQIQLGGISIHLTSVPSGQLHA